MTWLLVTILAYFFLAIVSLFDRYFLVGSMPNYKVYAFNVGIVGFLVCLLLVPFGISFSFTNITILGIFIGLIRFFAIFFLAKSIIRSEISRVIPAIGGFIPIFSFILFTIFFPDSRIVNFFQVAAFLLLVFGSVLISLRGKLTDLLSFKGLKYPVLSAFLFALTFFLSKNLYLETSFVNGLFLILFGCGLGAIMFLTFSEVRKNIFNKNSTQRISILFILGQAFGGMGVFLQQYAIFLAKPGQVPLVNALEGTRYAFLLFFVFILAKRFPRILKEEISGKVVFQKAAAILVIALGLAILTLE